MIEKLEFDVVPDAQLKDKQTALSQEDKAAIKKVLLKAAARGYADELEAISSCLQIEFLKLNRWQLKDEAKTAPLTLDDVGTLKHIAAHAALTLIRNGGQMEDICARLESELRRVNGLALTEIDGLRQTGRNRFDFE